MLFSEIIGQEGIKNALVKGYYQNHVAHAQLLVGKSGGAGLALALAYATFINCYDKKENDACGKCASCHKFSKLIHPDLHFVFPTAATKELKAREDFLQPFRNFCLEKPFGTLNDWSNFLGAEDKQLNIPVSESRYISKILSMKPYDKGYKILILWLPEMMRAAAANALLKGLEEPPAKTLFLLVSENAEQILMTIWSRCQPIRVPPYQEAEVAHFLVTKGVLQEKAREIAPIAGGNFSEALRLASSDDNNRQEWLREWLRICFKNQIADMVAWADRFQDLGKEEQKNLLRYGLHIFRNALAIQMQAEDTVRLDTQTKTFAQNFAKVLTLQNAEVFLKLFDEAYFHIERNANVKILFLDLSLQIARWLKR
jgi:DNA polymerase-3 subunit delta'